MTQNEDRKKSLATRGYRTPPSMFDDIERMFNDFWGTRDFWLPSISTRRYRVPMMDIRDTGDAYVMEGEFPGMNKEDVEIEITEGGLRISAKKDETREEKGEDFIRRERGSLSFQRNLPLPDDSDAENIKARLEDGVLRLEVPKKEKPKERRKLVEVE